MLPAIPAALRRHISPAILAYSQKEVAEKISFIDTEFPRSHVHVDVMDGVFVSARCFCAPTSFRSLRRTHSFEAHLMVLHPLKKITEWKKAGASRVVFHLESKDDLKKVAGAIKALGMQAGVALNPDTPLSRGRLIFPLVDAILLMGVMPGYAGQSFIKKVFRKISAVRLLAPHATLIVDGGVTRENARGLLARGADQLVSTSMIYGSSVT